MRHFISTRSIGAIGVLLTCAACGSSPSTSTPTAPVTTTVAVSTGASVSSTRSQVPVGASEKMSAQVTFSSGTASTNPTGTWATDAPHVATISTDGVVTTLAPGDVTVSFTDASGVRGSKRLTVIGDFNGYWIGSYRIDGCTETSGFSTAGFCSTFAQNLSGPFTMTTAQSGSTVNASWTLGSFVFTLPVFGTRDQAAPVTGPFANDFVFSAQRGDYDIATATTWQLTQTGVDRFSGTLRITFTRGDLSGSGTFTARVPGLTRGTPPPPSGAFVSTVFFGTPQRPSFNDIRTSLQLR